MRRKKQQPEQPTYKSRVWFVRKEISHKIWNEEYKMKVWYLQSSDIISPIRATKEQAEEDYRVLGYKFSPTAYCQCNIKIQGDVMTEIRVQCHTEY